MLRTVWSDPDSLNFALIAHLVLLFATISAVKARQTAAPLGIYRSLMLEHHFLDGQEAVHLIRNGKLLMLHFRFLLHLSFISPQDAIIGVSTALLRVH